MVENETVRKMIGYMRVSTDDQNLDMQRKALNRFGVPDDRIFSDKKSGSRMDRKGLELAVKACGPDVTLVVWKLDRLGRSTIGILDLLDDLTSRDVGIVSLTENIDTTSPHGKFFVTVIAAFAQLERDLIAERTKAGIAAAKERGVKMGPKHSVLGYPKRLKAFVALLNAGTLETMTGREIIEAMNAADPKAPKIKTPQSFYNWRREGFAGLPESEE